MISNAHRFHGRNSIRFVYQRGQTIRGPLVALRYVRNGRQQTYRAAVVVSRKVSKSAVVRNRIRRRIYEIVRNVASQITGPYDLVFTAYSEEAASSTHATLKRAVIEQLQKSGALQTEVSSDTKHATIGDVSNGSALGIHSSKQNAARKGEAVTAKPGRRKGETLSGLTPPRNKEENK